MNFDQPTYERIEAYLLDRLGPVERQAFERELAADPGLRAELEVQRTLLEGVQEAALKTELKQLHRELDAGAGGGASSFFRPLWSFLAIAAGIVGIAVLLWVLIPVSPEQPEVIGGGGEQTDSALSIPSDTLLDTVNSVKGEKERRETLPAPSPQPLVPDDPAPEPQGPVNTVNPDSLAPEVSAELAGNNEAEETESPRYDLPEGMVLIGGGTFRMGEAGIAVTLSDFFLDTREVSNWQYCEFLNAQSAERIDEYLPRWLLTDPSAGSRIRYERGGFRPLRGFEAHPVTAVTWEGAAAYARWAGKRLPTEAEWEYAARGGSLSQGYTFSGGNDASAVAWNPLNSGNQTHAGGLKAPNEAGLYDMSGNVWEWCADFYGPLPAEPQTDPQGPPRGAGRVVRGGSYLDLEGLRVTARQGLPPATGRPNLGFRCVSGMRP